MTSRAFRWSQLSSTQVEAQVVVGSSSRQGQFEVQLKLKAVELWSMRFTSLSSGLRNADNRQQYVRRSLPAGYTRVLAVIRNAHIKQSSRDHLNSSEMTRWH